MLIENKMIMYFLDVAVNANVSDLLSFLERENWFIPSCLYPFIIADKRSVRAGLTFSSKI